MATYTIRYDTIRYDSDTYTNLRICGDTVMSSIVAYMISI